MVCFFLSTLIWVYWGKIRSATLWALIDALAALSVFVVFVYILQSSTNANPEYLRLILGVPAEIVHIIDMIWQCGESNNLVAFDHSIADGVVKLTVMLPACAHFAFFNAPIGDKAIAHGI